MCVCVYDVNKYWKHTQTKRSILPAKKNSFTQNAQVRIQTYIEKITKRKNQANLITASIVNSENSAWIVRKLADGGCDGGRDKPEVDCWKSAIEVEFTRREKEKQGESTKKNYQKLV